MRHSSLAFASLVLLSPVATWAGEPPAADAAAADGTKPAEPPPGKPADWVDEKNPNDPNAKPSDKPPGTPDDKFGTDEDGKKPKSDTRYVLGARFRDFIVPNFLFGLFADGGPGAVNVFTGGPEFMIQTGSLEVIFSVTIPYADFSMNEFPFKSKSDPDQAYELVSSSLKLFTVSVDLLGRIPFDKKGTVAMLLGGGVGLSGVFGGIQRTQAYPTDPDNVDPSDDAKWVKCKRQSDPAGAVTPGGNAYCGTDNEHYPDADGNPFEEPSWTSDPGGSQPVVFPYIALPHIAIEVNPVEQFMVRVDTGFSITGFFLGLAAGGKLPI